MYNVPDVHPKYHKQNGCLLICWLMPIMPCHFALRPTHTPNQTRFDRIRDQVMDSQEPPFWPFIWPKSDTPFISTVIHSLADCCLGNVIYFDMCRCMFSLFYFTFAPEWVDVARNNPAKRMRSHLYRSDQFSKLIYYIGLYALKAKAKPKPKPKTHTHTTFSSSSGITPTRPRPSPPPPHPFCHTQNLNRVL